MGQFQYVFYRILSKVNLNIDPKLYAKYQKPSSSSSQDIMLTRFFYCYHARAPKKGCNSVNFSWNLLRCQSGDINIDLKPYAKYQYPSSDGSQDIVLTRFFYCYNGKAITLVKQSSMTMV